MTSCGSVTHIRSDFVMPNVKMGMWPPVLSQQGLEEPRWFLYTHGVPVQHLCGPWKGFGFGLTNSIAKTLSIVNVSIVHLPFNVKTQKQQAN